MTTRPSRIRLFMVALATLIFVGALAVAIWATAAAHRLRSRTFETPTLTQTLPSAPDAEAIARGEHLVSAIYACSECHGADFGGGVMVDDPAIGTLRGPNLTLGRGSVTRDYTFSDWSRIVRHGVLPDGRPALMPSEDYLRMSDRELMDIVAYVRSLPPVDADVPPPSLGPLGTLLVALGEFTFSADGVEDHFAPHAAAPPEPRIDAAFGEHLAAVCTGCHGAGLVGGPISGGPPDWPPAADLRPEAGLGAWSYEEFARAMREGRRPDGTMVADPMTKILPYARRMTETEMQALWAYLQSL